MQRAPHDVTELLNAWSDGDPVSREQLLPLVHSELHKLARSQNQLVDLRFFGGFSVEDTADILKVSAETVILDWRAAKAWLHRSSAGMTP